tara:strand:- start:103 stop:1038 length:936 start_codon:yes stop_codon:yes gene_type:complete
MSEESGEVTAEQMLAVAKQHDAAVEAGESPEVAIQPEEPKEEVQDESPPELIEEAVKEPDSEVQDVDEQVSSLTESEAPEAQEKPKGKWAKNEERKTSSWKQINAEKEEIKRQREELLKVAEEIKSQKQDIDEGKAYRDEHGFTAADYERSAERAELDGEYDDAADAKAIAKQVKADGEKAIQERETKKANDAYESKRRELMLKYEDLQKDSELTKRANAILQQNPSMANAHGMEKAVEIAQIQIEAAGAKELKSQNKELTDKLNKLEKKMSVNGGFTSEKLDGETPFEDLPDAEQEARLRKAAMALDDQM